MSLSNEERISQVASSARFIQAVRSCWMSLESVEDAYITEVALIHAYPRIGMVLSSKGGEGDYDKDYQAVIRLILSDPYGDDIHRIAAHLTAAHIIRNSPISDEVLKVSFHIENKALEDLDKITPILYRKALEKGVPAFYFEGTPTGTFNFYLSGLDRGQLIHSSVQANSSSFKEVLAGAINNLEANILATPNQSTIELGVRRRSPDIRLEVIGLSFIGSGLSYGTDPNDLVTSGTVSHLLSVEKGAASSFEREETSRYVNTLYLRGNTSYPSTLYLEGNDRKDFLIRGGTAEEVVFNIFQALREEEELTCLMVRPNAISFRSKRRSDTLEARTIGLISKDLEIATGDEIKPISSYSVGPRAVSVVVGLDQLKKPELAPHGAIGVIDKGPSPVLREAFDRIRRYRKEV